MTLCISNLFVINVNVRLYANHIFDSYWTLLTLKVIISMFIVYSIKCICTSVLFLFFLSTSLSCSYRSSSAKAGSRTEWIWRQPQLRHVFTNISSFYLSNLICYRSLLERWGEWHGVSPGPVMSSLISSWNTRSLIIKYTTSSLVLNN